MFHVVIMTSLAILILFDDAIIFHMFLGLSLLLSGFLFGLSVVPILSCDALDVIVVDDNGSNDADSADTCSSKTCVVGPPRLSCDSCSCFSCG